MLKILRKCGQRSHRGHWRSVCIHHIWVFGQWFLWPSMNSIGQCISEIWPNVNLCLRPQATGHRRQWKKLHLCVFLLCRRHKNGLLYVIGHNFLEIQYFGSNFRNDKEINQTLKLIWCCHGSVIFYNTQRMEINAQIILMHAVKGMNFYGYSSRCILNKAVKITSRYNFQNFKMFPNQHMWRSITQNS